MFVSYEGAEAQYRCSCAVPIGLERMFTRGVHQAQPCTFGKTLSETLLIGEAPATNAPVECLVPICIVCAGKAW